MNEEDEDLTEVDFSGEVRWWRFPGTAVGRDPSEGQVVYVDLMDVLLHLDIPEGPARLRECLIQIIGDHERGTLRGTPRII